MRSVPSLHSDNCTGFQTFLGTVSDNNKNVCEILLCIDSVAASNNKGFMVANFYTKLIVLVHPTVMSDGVEVRNIGRVQSMRRSLRSSLRRRSSTIALEERRKIAASFNLETGEDEGGKSSRNRRAMSADAGLALNDGPLVQVDIPPEQRGIVTYLVFAETHISG